MTTTKKRRQPRRRTPGELPPITVRVGTIRHELDARSDGTIAGYRATIQRDLARYYRLVDTLNQFNPTPPSDVFVTHCLNSMIHDSDDHMPVLGKIWDARDYPLLDAIERAHILVQHAGMTVEDALVSVGLVKE